MVNDMERLTERELNVMDCASYTKCNTDECVGYCGGCNAEEEAKLKLKHYEDLEEQGLLLKLPCKVGDVVYSSEYEEVEMYTVTSFRVYETGICAYNGFTNIGKVGVSVFLTKAEAEKALAEMRCNNGEM